MLLELLEKALLHDNKKFVTRGSHSMIYGCSLLVWLPGDIVHAMNMEFGGQLRWQLVQFLSHQIDEKSYPILKFIQALHGDT